MMIDAMSLAINIILIMALLVGLQEDTGDQAVLLHDHRVKVLVMLNMIQL
jgi:hypothetical protein